MKNLIFQTGDNWTGFIVRSTIGIVILPHGAQLVLGVFDGPGYDDSMSFLTEVMSLPVGIAFISIMAQFVGAISLLLGLATRVWAIIFILLFDGIMITSHFSYGFFMNWYGQIDGQGFESRLLIIGLSLALLANGAGRLSLDRLIVKH